MAPLSQWLQLMLAEIARKREDLERAREEAARRESEERASALASQREARDARVTPARADSGDPSAPAVLESDQTYG